MARCRALWRQPFQPLGCQYIEGITRTFSKRGEFHSNAYIALHQDAPTPIDELRNKYIASQVILLHVLWLSQTAVSAETETGQRRTEVKGTDARVK